MHSTLQFHDVGEKSLDVRHSGSVMSACNIVKGQISPAMALKKQTWLPVAFPTMQWGSQLSR